MGLEAKDMSGEPRSEEDIQEAIKEVEKTIVQALPGTVQPSLFVLLPTIRDGLKELLFYRNKISEAGPAFARMMKDETEQRKKAEAADQTARTD